MRMVDLSNEMIGAISENKYTSVSNLISVSMITTLNKETELFTNAGTLISSLPLNIQSQLSAFVISTKVAIRTIIISLKLDVKKDMVKNMIK